MGQVVYKNIKYRLTFVRDLLPFTVGVRKFFILNALLSIISLALSFVKPTLYRMFIDEVILKAKINMLFHVVVGYLFICLVDVLFGYIKQYNNNRLINRTVFRVKHRIWKGFFKLNFAEYEKQNIGDAKMKIEEDTSTLPSFANQQTIDYAIAYISMIFSAILLFTIDWHLALFSIIVIPISMFLDNTTSKREKYYNEKMRINGQNTTAWLQTSIQGWREVKALNLQRHERHTFMRFLHENGKLYSKWVHYWTIRVMLLPRIRDDLFMQFGLYFLGGILIINNRLGISDLLVFSVYYGMLSDAIKTVSTADAELQSSMPHTNRVLGELTKAGSMAKCGIAPDSSNVIVFENVSFAYDGSDKKVITGFSLRINRGERIAITGKSGCGKTTILKLMTGMLTPDEGSVSFSGVDLKRIDIRAMHRRMGFVMQENLLFNTTIKENLTFGKNDATKTEMIDACKRAYIYDFIESLPNGLDTVIGERGIRLSGGQRQRIVLARLFLRNADIIIFDEATSALDQFSENTIQEAIRNIGHDKTLIVVAHRKSSIELCDRVVRM